jgi:hypothetical protein
VIAEVQAEERGLFHTKYDTWWTEAKLDYKSFDECLFSYTGSEDSSSSCVFRKQGSIIALDLNDQGSLSVKVFADSIEHTKAVIKQLKKQFRAAQVKDEKIKVSFWHLGGNGPQETRRYLIAPTWADIKANYASNTAKGIENLMIQKFDAEQSGKLILWTGQPGTGKTFAIRAMGQEWKDFADIHYVIDPEQFFGTEAGYLCSVLLDEHQNDKWRLIVLEDTGELLSKDAKQRTGQGLSRLLNVCDGLLGQGLKVLVLITTNEEMGSLHEAVSRSGRCAADIFFKPLSVEEGRSWATEHKVLSPEKELTLAELYAIKTGDTIIKRIVKKVGFQT